MVASDCGTAVAALSRSYLVTPLIEYNRVICSNMGSVIDLSYLISKMITQTTEAEKQSIKALRESFGQKLDVLSDHSLVKWLRANNGDMETVVKGLNEHLLFRKAFDLDVPKDWTPPEVAHYFMCYDAGIDKEGAPVVIQPFGRCDVVGIMKSLSCTDYMRVCFQGLERANQRADKIATEQNAAYVQVYFITDLLSNDLDAIYTYKVFTNSFITMVSVLMKNYPLLFKKVAVIRAHSMTRIGFSLVKPFLSSETLEVVHISGEDFQSSLLEDIDPSQLPEFYGGTMTDLKSNIKEGKIPESYYYKRSQPFQSLDFAQVTVQYGDRRSLPFDVKEPGTKLRWIFETDGEDVGFVILFEENDESDLTVVVPYLRLETINVPESGSIICEKAGTYYVEFDNTYAFLTPKEVSYRIDLIPPA